LLTYCNEICRICGLYTRLYILKFGEYMCYISRDIGFFLKVTFLARPVNVETNTENRGQSNVAKVDIARLIMSCAKEILSMSSIIFSRWRHTS